jgi:PAS domain S-box-containing protein
MFENNTAVKLLLDPKDGSIIDANPAAAAFYGWSRDELRRMAITDINILPRAEIEQEMSRAVDEGRHYFHFRHRLASGEIRDVEVYTGPFEVEGRTLLFSVIHDITERRRAELVQSALYRISEAAGAALEMGEFYAAVHAIVGELMYAENFYIALHDAANGTLSFPYFVDAVDPPPGTVKVGRGPTERVLSTGQPLLATRREFAALAARGEIEDRGGDSVSWLGVPLQRGDRTFGVLAVQSYQEEVQFGEADKQVLTFVSRHIASALERKWAREERQRSLSLLRATLESTADGILVVDQDGKIVSHNRKFVEMWNVPAEVMATGDDSRALAAVLDQLVDPDGFLAKVEELYNDPKAESFDFLEFKDGRLFERYSQPQRIGGRTVGRVWSFRDISDRHRLEQQLLQAQKMEAIGRLAGGVAHDFNNLLTVITGYSDLVLGRLAGGDPNRADIEEIRQAGKRAADLTRQLLAFSRRQVLSPKPVNLNKVMQDMEKLLRRVIGEDIELVIRLDDSLGLAVADPGQLEQVILNLAVNARDAMPEGGRLTLATENVDFDPEATIHEWGLARGPYVSLSVSDTGSGIDEAVLERIFEPFFTTKGPGRGTGLGLATVYGIVRQSGGQITVDSQPGAGTAFRILLPRTRQVADAASGLALSPAPPRGSETILLVEDEAAVRALLSRYLRQRGYTVYEAADGVEALEIAARRTKDVIHLLLTDVVMPRMGGVELAERLQAERPGVKVVFMSGYAGDQLGDADFPPADAAFVQKPFSTERLSHLVREVLDAADSVAASAAR